MLYKFISNIITYICFHSILGYVIEKRLTESRSQWERVDKVDSSVTLYCVESLREQSEYEFRIFAENPVGMSEEAAITERVILKTHASKSNTYDTFMLHF